MQGMTPDQYDERVRYGLAMQQLPASIQGSAFTPKSLAQRLTELAEQQREVQGLAFRGAQDYAAKVQPTDAQLQAYYDAHRNDFATPATATIQYLLMSPATLAAAVAAERCGSEKVLRRQHRALPHGGEVRASHILISAPKDASAADKDKAKQKAEEMLAQMKARPDQFAQIAQAGFAGPRSASKGGDLGYFARGMIAGGKAFDDAAVRSRRTRSAVSWSPTSAFTSSR